MSGHNNKTLVKVAGFMSGSGSNLRRLLEFAHPAFKVEFLFSDTADSHIRQLALDYNLPYFIYDIKRFYEALGHQRRIDTPQGWTCRQLFDQVPARLVAAFAVDIIALGGYMSFLTLPQGGVNVHPGDLSLKDASGQRLLTGAHAVADAILCGRPELRASTIWIDQGVDSGPLLLLSDPVPVRLSCPLEQLRADSARLRQVADEHQQELKRRGDWIIFPLTIQLLAQGRLIIKERIAWLDGQPYPNGITLDQLGRP